MYICVIYAEAWKYAPDKEKQGGGALGAYAPLDICP